MSGFVVLPIDPFAATVKYTMPTRKTRERSKRLYTLAEVRDILGRLRGTSLEAPFIIAYLFVQQKKPLNQRLFLFRHEKGDRPLWTVAFVNCCEACLRRES